MGESNEEKGTITEEVTAVSLEDVLEIDWKGVISPGKVEYQPRIKGMGRQGVVNLGWQTAEGCIKLQGLRPRN